MKSPLRILLLEDNPADEALIRATLRKDGIDCDVLRVETKPEFLSALKTRSFDLILSDCSLPSFDGFSALQITRDLKATRARSGAKPPETPFIFVSGTMGEELAIDMLKTGATDYVLKQRISRLGPAVRRAIAEAEERTAREAAERSRSEAESLFRSLFDNVAVGVAIADMEGRIVKANWALGAMLGYGEGELSHAELVSLTHQEHATAGAEAYEELCAGKRTSYQIEKRLVRRDGSAYWAHVTVSLIRNSDAVPRFSVSLIEDITERKEMQQRFLEAQKMEVVGRLAAGVAHDFNNFLTIINGYSQVLIERMSLDEPTRRELQEIRSAGERATTLTQRLLAFSRQQVQQRSLCDLNSIITGLDHMLRRLIGEEVRLTVRLDPEAGLIEEDQTQIEQIVMNLAINARDAMPDGGELIIATEHARLDDDAASTQSVAPGDYVVLAVTDTGHGIDEATKLRIFEPFFTTKEVGKGTGLGLWMISEIVKQSRGSITVDSEPGRGTTFRICLPQVGREAGATLINLARSFDQASLGGSETIMLVEENPNLRAFAREVLEKAGYRVLVAHGAADALTTAQREAKQIHLLMTDVAICNGRGTDLMASLADGRPEMRVLYLSNCSSGNIDGEAARRASAYLRRPFTEGTLLQRVREVLDAPSDISIIVADDDPAIRSFLLHVLQPAGYHVLEASNGRQALHHLRQRSADLLITDLIMPEHEGLETIRVVREKFPEVGVVAMSGGFGEQYLKVARMLGACEVLQKPFGADSVRETVWRVLAARANKQHFSKATSSTLTKVL